METNKYKEKITIIDNILNIISIHNALSISVSDIEAKLKERNINLIQEETRRYIKYLEAENYITVQHEGTVTYVALTGKGILFSEQGGKKGEIEREKSKTRWHIAYCVSSVFLVIVTFLNFLYIFCTRNVMQNDYDKNINIIITQDPDCINDTIMLKDTMQIKFSIWTK